MNSETSTRYGSRVRRHGRSRAARAHQANKRRVNVVFTFPRSFVFTPFFPSRTLSSPPFPPSALLSSLPFPLPHFCPHPLSPSPFGRGGTRNSPFVPPLHVVERGSGGEDHDAERGHGVENH